MRARTVEPHEWARWRAFRLRALASDPPAFGATLAEEEAQPDAWWIERATPGPHGARFVAEDADVWLGTLGLAVKDDAPELLGLWVAPEARGRGVGALLLRAAEEHARATGARRVALWVNAENAHALALYRREGFAPDGPPVRGTRDPTRMFQKLSKPV